MAVNRVLLALAALAAGSAAAADVKPFGPEQAGQVRCVAILSIVASEQQRGVAPSLAYPPLAESGAHFAQVVGERLMRETGRTKEEMRDAFVAGVAAQQDAAKAGGAPRDLPREAVTACLEMMEAVAPAPPPPSLPQCAAMVKLAYDDVHAREGLSNEAKDLATIAAVLDARARSEMGGQGRSPAEIEALMAKSRAEIAKEAARRAADDVAAGLDFEACFDMAKD